METRNELAARYGCGNQGVRCIDGHVGLAFVQAQDGLTGYFDGHKYYELGNAGGRAQVNVFALAHCAESHLSTVEIEGVLLKDLDKGLGADPKKASASGNGSGAGSGSSATTSEGSASNRSDARSGPSMTGGEASGSGSGTGSGSSKTCSQRSTNTTSWPSVAVGSAHISVVSHEVSIPSDDDAKSLLVVITNSCVGDGGKDKSRYQIWPENTFTIQIRHGRYHFDAGLMFVAVYHGKRSADGDTTGCHWSSPDACHWAFQSMLSGTFFLGRNRLVAYERRNWIPGLQIGLNSDLTKIGDAFSVGLALEPVTGLAISLGGMLYSRASSTTQNSDGTTPSELRIVPYIGVTLDKEIYNTITSSGKDPKGQDAKQE